MSVVKIYQILELENIIKSIIKSIKRDYEDDLISFEEFISQKFLGEECNIRFEKVKFPLTISLVQGWSKEGYMGGRKYTKLLKGKIVKEIDKYTDEDQYTEEIIKKVIVEPEEGEKTVMVYKYYAWYGEKTLFIYYEDDEFIDYLKMEYKKYKENFKKEYFQKLFKIDKKETEKIKKEIEKIMNSVYTIIKRNLISNDLYCSGETNEIEIRFFDKGNNEILYLHIYDWYCNSDWEIKIECLFKQNGMKAIFYLKKDCDWVQKGYAGPNVLICDKDKKIEHLKLFFILNKIVNKLPIKFVLKESEVKNDEDFTEEYVYEKWERI